MEIQTREVVDDSVKPTETALDSTSAARYFQCNTDEVMIHGSPISTFDPFVTGEPNPFRLRRVLDGDGLESAHFQAEQVRGFHK